MPTDKVLAQQHKKNELLRLVTAVHAAPRHNLATEPWIRVHDYAQQGIDLGLRELLLHAHELRDLAEPTALTRAALRRFLIALTAYLVRSSEHDQDAWGERLRTNSGFTEGEVDTLLTDIGDSLWLYHPVSPFLQNRRLIEAMPNPDPRPLSELVPHLPREGEPCWFSKPRGPDATSVLQPAEAARVLVTRWFYTLNGNSADVSTPSGTVRAQAGSAYAGGMSDLTHVFRVSPVSLFVTLLRNLTTRLVEHPEHSSSGLAWAVTQRPHMSDDPLYLYTLTATAVLLSPTPDGQIKALRGPVPEPKDFVEQLRNTARDADPHRVLIEGRTPTDSRVLRILSDEHRVSSINALRRPAWPANHRRLSHGVIAEDQLWLSSPTRARQETLELLLACKQGTPSGPKWSETTTVALPALVLDPELAALDGILVTCFAPTTGIQARLSWAIRQGLGRRDRDGRVAAARLSDPPVQRTVDTASRAWLDDAQLVVEQVISGRLQEVDATAKLWRAARTAFRAATAPYAATVRYTASLISAEAALRRPTLGDAITKQQVETSAHARPQYTGSDAEYIDWLLPALQRPEVRSALRRGDIPATEDRAYRYLARFWRNVTWLRTPLLLHAAAAASHPQIRQREGVGLGDLAANLVKHSDLSDNTVAARLLAVQRMDLSIAHRHLASILHAAAARAEHLDWQMLYDLYRGWNRPDPQGRQRHRRTLLEQFHTRIPG